MTKIMGLDLATKKSGYSIFYDDKLIDYGIFTSNKDETNIHTRIIDIKHKILDKIREHDAKYIIAEQVPINIHSNLKVGGDLLIMQGVLLSICDDFDLGLQLLSPSAWRSIVGTYDKSKESKRRDYQKQKAVDLVNNIYGLDLKYYKTYTAKNGISDDDIAEAILLGLAYIKKIKGE